MLLGILKTISGKADAHGLKFKEGELFPGV
jgi:hypothetical protein